MCSLNCRPGSCREAVRVEKCYAISAVTQTGLQPLLHGLGDHFASLDEARKQAEARLDQAAGQDAHNYSKMLREARLRRRQGLAEEEDLELDDGDDGDVMWWCITSHERRRRTKTRCGF